MLLRMISEASRVAIFETDIALDESDPEFNPDYFARIQLVREWLLIGNDDIDEVLFVPCSPFRGGERGNISCQESNEWMI